MNKIIVDKKFLIELIGFYHICNVVDFTSCFEHFFNIMLYAHNSDNKLLCAQHSTEMSNKHNTF